MVLQVLLLSACIISTAFCRSLPDGKLLNLKINKNLLQWGIMAYLTSFESFYFIFEHLHSAYVIFRVVCDTKASCSSEFCDTKASCLWHKGYMQVYTLDVWHNFIEICIICVFYIVAKKLRNYQCHQMKNLQELRTYLLSPLDYNGNPVNNEVVLCLPP